MTESEFTAAQAAGTVEQEAPLNEPEGGSSAPESPSVPIDQFIPILTQLQSVQRTLGAPPTFIPQSFQDQIQFVFDGTNYYLYLYFNNQWNSFSVSGSPGVTQILAGTGISISPVGGTGAVTISRSGAGSSIATARGTDSYSGTTPFTVTHTITHGLGVRPALITIVVPTIVSPGPSGSGTNGQEPQGWFTLDTNGNSVAGMAFVYTHVYGGSGSNTLTGAELLTNSITASTSTSGGTGHVTITVNNVTDTTFDIVYSSTDTSGSGFTSPTITWTVLG